MNNRTLILLVSILLLISLDAFTQSSWEVAKNEDGIVVYTRAEKSSAFKSFKAITTLEASTDEIIKKLKDADNYSKWYGYTKTSKLIKQEDSVQFNYVETIFPWPFANRDMVYRMSIHSLHSGVIKISLNGLPNYMPEKKGITRMQKADGYLLLKPLDGKTEITYEFHSEPGDNIPIWLANNSIAELPFITLLGLREVLKEN
jgi:START domain